MEKDKALKLLGQYRDQLTRQQLLTLRGQIKAGAVDAAVKGLTRIVMGENTRIAEERTGHR